MWLLAMEISLMYWLLPAIILLAGAWLLLWIRIRLAKLRSRSIRDRMKDGSLSPRAWHYHFAHSALRTMAFEDPDRLIVALSAPEADEFLAQLWQTVGREIVMNDSPQAGDWDRESLDSEGLEALPARVAGRPAAIVRLPEPRRVTEAWFVAIVLNHEIDEAPKPTPEPPLFYYTLEKGFAPGDDRADARSKRSSDATRTVFCQWDQAAHKNYGDGPPPDARAFLNFIAARLAVPTPASPSRAASRNRSSGIQGN